MKNLEFFKIKPQGIEHGLVGSALADIEWDFKKARERTEEDDADGVTMSKGAGWLKDVVKAFADTMEAINSIGWLEHTCDWDPYLTITMRDGSRVESDSHYYQVNGYDDENLYIEAPEPQYFEETETEVPSNYLENVTMDGFDLGPVIKFKISEIDLIQVETQ